MMATGMSPILACRTQSLSPCFVKPGLKSLSAFQKLSTAGWVAPEAFWIFYLGALLYWLHDSSPGKQHTLAFLDRSLSIGVSMLKQGKR